MPHTSDHARRLMRELKPSLPAAAEVVLDRQKYWDPGFAELFFEYVEDLIFQQPQVSLGIADVARRLAHALPEGTDSAGKQRYREYLVKAYGLLGSACRARGQLGKADEVYRTAMRLCGKRSVSRSCRGELYLRLAILRAYQNRHDAALPLVEKARVLFEVEKDEEWLGRTWATQGAVLLFADRFSEAVLALSEALGGYRLTARVELSAAANLSHAVSETDDPHGLKKAHVQLRRARQLAGPRQSVQKSFFYWIEGRIHVRRGSTERAERSYRKALRGFIKFQAPYEIALVGLDISSLFRFSKRWTELEEQAADTYRRFRELQEDTEALAALKLYLEGARARSLTIEAISQLKTEFAARKHRAPAALAASPGTA